MVYKCERKIRDKNNNIIGYILIKSNGAREHVKPEALKQAMLNDSVRVVNLKLTSDGKLIDKNDRGEKRKENEDINSNEGNNLQNLLNSGYTPKNKTEAAQNNYIMKKSTSKRVGKAMTKALILGMACLSLGGALTGCGYSGEVAASNAITSESPESATRDTVYSAIEKINNASEIKVDVKHFQLGNRAVISVGNEEIGTMQGKFAKIFDTITFNTTDDQQIAVGDQGAHLILDNWAVYDQDGNPTYQMKEKITLTLTKYIISDKDGNEVAYLKQKFSPTTRSAKIYDMNDNLIAEIKQSPFRHDFTIEIKDGCEIDNVSLATISVNYMMNKINSEKSNSNSSNKNK